MIVIKLTNMSLEIASYNMHKNVKSYKTKMTPWQVSLT